MRSFTSSAGARRPPARRRTARNATAAPPIAIHGSTFTLLGLPTGRSRQRIRARGEENGSRGPAAIAAGRVPSPSPPVGREGRIAGSRARRAAPAPRRRQERRRGLVVAVVVARLEQERLHLLALHPRPELRDVGGLLEDVPAAGRELRARLGERLLRLGEAHADADEGGELVEELPRLVRDPLGVGVLLLRPPDVADELERGEERRRAADDDPLPERLLVESRVARDGGVESRLVRHEQEDDVERPLAEDVLVALAGERLHVRAHRDEVAVQGGLARVLLLGEIGRA